MTNEIIKKLEDVRYHLIGSSHKAVIDEAIDYIKELEEMLTSAENNTIVRVDRLLKRKKEIEKLKNDIFCISSERDAWKDTVNITATEAIKEFAEKLKNRFFNYYDVINENTSKSNYRGETLMAYEVADMIEDCIDSVAEEMVGADNG